MSLIKRRLTRPRSNCHTHRRALASRLTPKLSLACVCLLFSSLCVANFQAQTRLRPRTRPAGVADSAAATAASPQTNDAVLTRILAAEDTRVWNTDIALLLQSRAATIRTRAALAAGRIGDERAVAPLVRLLRTDADEGVRAMAAFALGEIESAIAADALLEVLQTARALSLRTRAVEALGKIAAALPDGNEIRRAAIGDAILRTLDVLQKANASPVSTTNATATAVAPTRATPRPAAVNRAANALAAGRAELARVALTAVLRARPVDASASVQAYSTAADADTRATALNTLARLRVKNANESVRPLLADADPIVRANAARVLGAGEAKESVEALVARMKEDADARVRVSAIRALASIKDASAATELRQRLATLLASHRTARVAAGTVSVRPTEANELLEIAVALGALSAGSGDAPTLEALRALRDGERLRAPEIEVALARIAPSNYLRDAFVVRVTDTPVNHSWQTAASVAEALGEIARLTSGESGTSGNSNVITRADASIRLRGMLDAKDLSALARPAVLRALTLSNPSDMLQTLQAEMSNSDVFVRATVVELLSEIAVAETSAPETRTAIVTTFVDALAPALKDDEPDAALALLAALNQSNAPAANTAIESALAADDYLVRHRAATLLDARALKSNASNSGDGSNGNSFAARSAALVSQYTAADYQRAVARSKKRVQAVVTTDKGAFTIELLPADAPLTVDNFVTLAARGFFNNVPVHRVVPNFVMQTGDQPRGDGNGGPGYQIRCEINTVPYARGAIGMALSGKDTGGSQWFVTHSPQPHLDGGYTVFGRVTAGMDTVDRIVRGDRIRDVRVTETTLAQPRRPAAAARKGAR